jgi:hypothetical protein
VGDVQADFGFGLRSLLAVILGLGPKGCQRL